MSEPDLETLVTTAESAVSYARMTRRFHARRWKRGTPQRETDLRVALARLRKAMEPVRREISRSAYLQRPPEEHAILRETSAAIQRERRKLWKMKGPT